MSVAQQAIRGRKKAKLDKRYIGKKRGEDVLKKRLARLIDRQKAIQLRKGKKR